MLAKFSGLNPKGPYLSLVKEKETSSIKPATEIRKFHVALRATTAQKRTKKCDARGKLFFCQSKPIDHSINYHNIP